MIWPGNKKTRLSLFERFSQTVASIHSVSLQQPKARIILCDASAEDYGRHIHRFFPELINLHIQTKNPGLARQIRLHPNKSYGECKILSYALDFFESSGYSTDFLIKLSGRYLPEGIDDTWLHKANANKYLLCRQEASDTRNWVDNTGFEWSLARNPQYPSVKRLVFKTILYAVGSNKLEPFRQKLRGIIHNLGTADYRLYDIENLLPYVLAPDYHSGDILRTNWTCLGWNGMTAALARY